MNPSDAIEAIEKPLSSLPYSLSRHILEHLRKLTSHEPVIGIMGKSGAGKSSLCNALFQGEVTPVSDVYAGTREVQRFRLSGHGHSMVITDLPGVGESRDRDAEYEALYRDILPELDLVLWLIKADDRALSVDEYFWRHILHRGHQQVLFVVTQADKTEPCHEWDIRHVVTVRNAALQQTETLIRQLTEISVLTKSIGGKSARDWAMKQDFRCGCWLMEKPETAMKAITRNLDREIWRDLMQRSGMLSLMDAQARDTWYRSLEYDNFPEISEANILSTFKQLHQNKDEVFERGVINVFRGLSWNYKTNCPCKFGSKIIINNLVRWDRWGFHLITGQQADRLADLERMLHLFSGKPIPDNRENITIHLDDHIRSVQGKECYEDEMFSIRYFKKGSAHITFRKPELVDRLNDIIARHYPEMLPSQ